MRQISVIIPTYNREASIVKRENLFDTAIKWLLMEAEQNGLKAPVEKMLLLYFQGV